MPNIVPSPNWDEIPLIDVDTPALGGPNGPTNDQAKALANRLEFFRRGLIFQPFDSVFAASIGGYPEGAEIKRADGVRVTSTIDGNLNDPNSNMTGWEADSVAASEVSDASAGSQQNVNDFGGKYWYSKPGGYSLHARAILLSGERVRSTTAANVVNPNNDMTGWTLDGGGSSSGGINVIEYTPSENEVLTPIVAGDFAVEGGSASWNPSTLTMGVAVPQAFELLSGETPTGVFSEFVAIKLDKIPNRGIFTVDASANPDAFGFVALPEDVSISEFLSIVHVSLANTLPIPYNPAFFMTGVVGATSFNFIGTYSKLSEMYLTNSSPIGDFPPVVTSYPTVVDSPTQLQANHDTLTEQEIYDGLVDAFGVTIADEYRNLTAMDTGDATLLELDKPLTSIYFFITPYIDVTDMGPVTNFNLNPASAITLDISALNQVANVVPSEAVDGDFLHILRTTDLLGKYVSKGDFVQLYDGTSKMIVHGNQP